MSTFTLPDSRVMAYDLTPSPTPLPIILLSNPLLTSYRAWDRVTPVLQAAGFRVLRYDQPGHGSSTAPSNPETTTFSSIADDVAQLLRHLGVERLHAWVGVSMGAATGVYFATRHPGIISRLVVCDTISASPANAGVPDAFADRVLQARTAGNVDTQVQSTLERWFGAGWLKSEEAEASRMRDLMVKTSVGGFEACVAALRSQSFDLRPLLPEVGKGCEDALLIVGENDADLPVKMEELRAGIEDSLRKNGKEGKKVDLVVIKNAGHAVFVDGFEDFCKTLLNFVQQ
ncbi:hypothetical protein MCOR27_010587 [Pyricularia oryzae]|uniref:AB hydrolase-1 domain-containing protein n=1 Tax=Pyricularia grisea TaxID=148305 RepID=A0ABQ8N4F5_PYRGI|nr:hypothetical protein MCOR01_001548 [Pyricularia oryzae]KAI6291062.1 hypothetical protein MCOR33_010867 [Pyricularia grisea]KAH9429897.1 hypothetical protein MCOR02_009627 [Pyricularia oryzae]KAI6252589.1 hypothetical protein MCOR19_010796 [Pyricularia oryzae]KAI6267032.1 hypothetical protein MCOR26_009905 [Pyricularia oryzae]